MDVFAALQGVPALGPALPWIVLAAAVCSAVATILPAPTPAAPGWWVIVYRAINLVALNIGAARNADDAAAAKRAGLKAVLCLLLLPPLLSACAADGRATPEAQAAITAGVTVAAIAAAHNKDVATVVAEGQLYCRTATGILALVKPNLDPTSVIGRSSDMVAWACQGLAGVPVPPPPNPGAVPAVPAPAAGL